MRRTPIPAALVAALLFVWTAGEAHAHKMIAARRVHEDGTVLLQAFFPDGKPARGVQVEVRRPDGSLFAAERTDGQGKLVIRPDDMPGQWTATFLGSMGHRTETQFTMGRAASAQGAPAAAPNATAAPGDESLIVKEPVPWWNVLAGLGFILGLSAFLMCLNLRREVARLKR